MIEIDGEKKTYCQAITWMPLYSVNSGKLENIPKFSKMGRLEERDIFTGQERIGGCSAETNATMVKYSGHRMLSTANETLSCAIVVSQSN